MRVIQLTRIGCGHQGCSTAAAVALVPSLQIGQHRVVIGLATTVFNLRNAARGALFGASGQKHFQTTIRKHYRAHIAPIGHQPRQAPKATLQIQQSRAHPWVHRYLRCALPHFFGAYAQSNLLPAEQNFRTSKANG